MSVYLGVDPGDKWIGWAKLTVSEDAFYHADMGVFSTKPESLVVSVDKLIDKVRWQAEVGHIIVESFQQRPLGHNKFGRGATLRFLGAMQYAAMFAHLPWSEVPPGPPEEINKLHIGKYINQWMKWVPANSNPNWRHAWSAWRVIARYLHTLESPDLTRLARPKKLPPLGFDHTNSKLSGVGELVAPHLSWTK